MCIRDRTTPAPAAPQEMVATAEKKQAADSVLVAEAAAKAAQIPAVKEPVIAAATPAPVAAPIPVPAPIADKQPPLASMTIKDKEPEAEPKLAAAFDLNKQGFTPGVYASAGLGVSRINPDTSAAPSFDIADNVAAAGQVTVGVDVLKNLSVEVHSADFGSTALSPEGRVNFHINGVSALLYAGKAAGRYRRNGWNGYAPVSYTHLTLPTIYSV